MKLPVPELIWPSKLRLPSDSCNVVYLDLKDWIALSKAKMGNTTGREFVDTLECCKAAQASGVAKFVLSSTHYVEVLKIKDPAQREALVNVMEELTGYATLVSRAVVMKLELGAVLDSFALAPMPFPDVNLIGYGALHAVGLGYRIVDDGIDGLSDTLASELLLLEHSMLRGPSDPDDLASVQAAGWNLDKLIENGEARAAEERAQSGRLDSEPSYRKNNLRDIVSAHEFIVEFSDALTAALTDRGLKLSDVMPDQESARAIARKMPSTDVAIELKVAWHRNACKQWTANDIYDIDALSLAVPYCDVVVTDKACHSALTDSHVADRMHTALLKDVRKLPKTLHTWRPTRTA